MPDPFIGQIMMFGGNFAPRGWALCNGQLISVAQNPALFSILGTTFGGDGRTTFALPDLRGRVAVHPGTGPGLTTRRLGEKGGAEAETLTVNQMPSHRHNVNVTDANANSESPVNKTLAKGHATQLNEPVEQVYGDIGSQAMHPETVRETGGSQAHNNMQPFQGVNFIIALVGIYPSRN